MKVHEELALLLLAEVWAQEFPLEQPNVEVWLDEVLVFNAARSRERNEIVGE